MLAIGTGEDSLPIEQGRTQSANSRPIGFAEGNRKHPLDSKVGNLMSKYQKLAAFAFRKCTVLSFNIEFLTI